MAGVTPSRAGTRTRADRRTTAAVAVAAVSMPGLGRSPPRGLSGSLTVYKFLALLAFWLAGRVPCSGFKLAGWPLGGPFWPADSVWQEVVNNSCCSTNAVSGHLVGVQ